MTDAIKALRAWQERVRGQAPFVVPEYEDFARMVEGMEKDVDTIEALQAECLEQARLNGKGAEREAALMARVEALQAENAKMREAIAYHYARNGTAYDIACDTLYADRAALTTQEKPE